MTSHLAPRCSFLSLIVLLCIVLPALPHVLSSPLDSWEALYLSVPSLSSLRNNLHYYTSIDHVAGTPGDYDTAVYTQQQFEAAGLQAEIMPLQTLINYPISRSLHMLAPFAYTPALSEDVFPQDPTSDNTWRNRSFHGYGASGNALAEVVYVNYGTVEDFHWLVQQNVNLTGKIALARYGLVFRGLKVRNAQLHNMAAMLIYSDPADDGYAKGPVYPEGRWRPEHGIQRGSVQFLSICSGDPGMLDRDKNICGYPTEDLIPNIPSLPLSYGDVYPILSSLGGLSVPSSWVGALNCSYRVGNGSVIVALNVSMEYTNATLWDVIATIPGQAEDPATAAQQVIIGNHRDAWVLGATDPNSGTVAMLEVARGLGVLLQNGWQPQRTIKLCSWDGEEYGLLGSTWYGEHHRDELIQNAILYMNVDVAVTGTNFIISLTPSLGEFLSNTTKSITDPGSGQSLYDAWDKQIGILGSGTDFSVFLHHLGVACMDMGFRDHDSGGYGVYHSVYDSFYWTTHFGDPLFVYHRAMAQLWGLLIMRMTNAVVLPFNFIDYSAQLFNYINIAKQTAIQYGMDSLDFTALHNAAVSFQNNSQAFECYRQLVLANPSNYPSSEVLALNQHLYMMERGFIRDQGLPQRPWFKHMIQAPGISEGYDANIFPSLLDDIFANDQAGAQTQLQIIASYIQDVSYNLLNSVPQYVRFQCPSAAGTQDKPVKQNSNDHEKVDIAIH